MVKLENPEVDPTSTKVTVSEKELKGTYWRFAQAAYLITDEVSKRAQGLKERTDKTEEIEKARQYAEEITAARPQWWGGPLLQAQIAELNRQPDRIPMTHRGTPARRRAGLHPVRKPSRRLISLSSARTDTTTSTG